MKAIEQLKRSKAKLRNYTRSLTPTEKIRQTELLQKRHFALLEAREANGGRAIPAKWLRWKQAQDEIR